MEQFNRRLVQKRHSRLGIAAVLIGVALPVLLVLFIMATGLLESERVSGRNEIEMYLLLLTLTFPLVHLLALILSLVGLFSSKTKKLFPIIGAILNAILLAAGVGLIYFIVANLTIPVH